MSRLLLCFALAVAACGGGSSSQQDPVDFGTAAHGDASTVPIGSDGGTTNNPTIYCGLADSTECACGNVPTDGYTAGQTCNTGSFASPSLCCATDTYPNDDESFFHSGCYCSQIFCSKSEFGDTCTCGWAVPDSTAHPVSTCTGFGPLCCRTKSTIAPLCACFTDLTQCPDGDETVSGCGPEDVQCSGQTLTSCN